MYNGVDGHTRAIFEKSSSSPLQALHIVSYRQQRTWNAIVVVGGGGGMDEKSDARQRKSRAHIGQDLFSNNLPTLL